MARPGRQSVMKETEAELMAERTWVKLGPGASAAGPVRAAMASLASPMKRRARTRSGAAGGVGAATSMPPDAIMEGAEETLLLFLWALFSAAGE
jgi:hypothetical protein